MSTPAAESKDQPDPPGRRGGVDQIARRVRRLEREEPLRGRILDRLAAEPLTPTALAEELDSAKESISRLLKALREEGLVETQRVPGDRRQRRYALTGAGEIELRRHRSYGDPGPEPVEPVKETTLRFLYAGLARSVELRRKDNNLDAAAARQRRILNQARKLKDGELVLETIHELAITLRQAGREAEAEDLLEDLNEIALGRGGYTGAGLSLQASAHRSYELGRRGECDGEGQRQRMNLLITATTNYCELAQGSPAQASRKWRERQAWSAYSLAANRRAASRLDDALRIAVSARDLFEQIEDSYGSAHSLFLTGYCLRLVSDFDGALTWLKRAHAVAEERSYVKLEIDSLMQIGEVHRCRAELEEARLRLEESRRWAEKMDLMVTQAFAESSLGAVAFAQGRWLDSQLELSQAKRRFKVAPHWEGRALTLRRLCVAARLVYKRTSTADLSFARELNQEAVNLYRHPNRPAGVVACSIEHDRLRMCEGRAPETIDKLVDLFENKQTERECVELDNWVPWDFKTFANETGDERLAAISEGVLAAAQDKREQNLRLAKEIIGGQEADRQDEPQLESASMGGETRLEGSLIKEPVAVPA